MSDEIVEDVVSTSSDDEGQREAVAPWSFRELSLEIMPAEQWREPQEGSRAAHGPHDMPAFMRRSGDAELALIAGQINLAPSFRPCGEETFYSANHFAQLGQAIERVRRGDVRSLVTMPKAKRRARIRELRAKLGVERDREYEPGAGMISGLRYWMATLDSLTEEHREDPQEGKPLTDDLWRDCEVARIGEWWRDE